MSKNWAICIGINRYYSLQPLKYAVQDASAMQDFFNEEKFERVFYFSDDSPEIDTPKGKLRSEPTFANLKRFFRERFATPFLGVGDNLWFFFAGHGELHGGHDYLMPVDVDPGNVEETALKISDICAYLRNSGADNTVLMLDACRSQGRRAPVGIGTDEQPGMVTIYSCSPRQSSYEIDEIGQGAFTHALLAGLRLQGANSCATVQRIDQYLRHQVPLINERYGRPAQTPYTEVKPLDKNCLILLPERARLEDVQSLKLAAYKAMSKSHWEFAQQLWTRVLWASRGDQDAIDGLQQIALSRAEQPFVNESIALVTEGSRDVDMVASELAEEKGSAVDTRSTAAEAAEDYTRLDVVRDVVTVDLKGNPVQRRMHWITYRQEDLGLGVVLKLVRAHADSFQIGSPKDEGEDNERPQSQITIAPFWIGQTLVTQAQWSMVAAMRPIGRKLAANPSRFKGANRPVEQVSWDDAVEFCRRLTRHSGSEYQLPSEAEWEYACRAGTTTPFHFGETLTSGLAHYDAYATYGDEPRGITKLETTDVGRFSANAFGLYDMHGNVWEWCQDLWHGSYDGVPSDGSVWMTGGNADVRVLRGGSWVNGPGACRSAYRNSKGADYSSWDIGFRVCCRTSKNFV